jgi:hypothetical protein
MVGENGRIPSSKHARVDAVEVAVAVDCAPRSLFSEKAAGRH